MIGTNSNSESAEYSWVEKGRDLLQRGDVSSAIECYGRAFDPDSLDETEARSALIEARSQLSRKHLHEALENFEEALLMGTEVQRRQALEGIAAIGTIRSRLVSLTAALKKGLKARLGRKSPPSVGVSLVSDDENLVLIAEEVIERLPRHLAKVKRISKLPQRFSDYSLPFSTSACICYTDEDDVRYILEVAESLVGPEQPRPSD